MTIEAVLRLSHKYQIDSLFKRAISWITFLYPDTLAKWDALPTSYIKLSALNALEAIRIGHELEIPQIMPAACWRTAIHTMGALYDVDLPRDLHRILILGRERLIRDILPKSTFFWIPSDSDYYCVDVNPDCLTAMRSFRENFFRTTTYMEPAFTLVRFRDFYSNNEDERTHGFCASCVERYGQRHTIGRKMAWNRLPDVFGFGSWTSIEARAVKSGASNRDSIL